MVSEQNGEFRPRCYTSNSIDAIMESLCVAMAGARSLADPGLRSGGG
jgi:hypothetical protein